MCQILRQNWSYVGRWLGVRYQTSLKTNLTNPSYVSFFFNYFILVLRITYYFLLYFNHFSHMFGKGFQLFDLNRIEWHHRRKKNDWIAYLFSKMQCVQISESKSYPGIEVDWQMVFLAWNQPRSLHLQWNHPRSPGHKSLFHFIYFQFTNFHSIIYFPLIKALGLISLTKHCKVSLTLWAPISQNGQTQSNNSPKNCRRIVWVCLTILWDWRLKS